MADHQYIALDAQQSILGSMLIDPKCIGVVLAEIQADDFDCLPNRAVYTAIHALFTQDLPVDPITVLDRMKQDGTYDEGSYGFIEQLLQITPTSANVMAYVRILKQARLLHRLQITGMRIVSASTVDDCNDALAEAQQLLADRPGVKIVGMGEALRDFYARHDPDSKPEYLRWGLAELDGTIHAFPGSMIVIGGYPSDGKTSLAVRFAASMAQEKRVGFFSYETSVPALFDRLASMTTAVPLPEMQKNTIPDAGWDTVAAMHGKIEALHLEILEAGGMGVAQIRAMALARRYDIVYIDYLQKITPAQTSRWQSSFEAVSQISNDLQQFGRQTGISVVALSQLSRPERSKGQAPPPTLSSLRQSGQIEQDADVVFLLYREEPDRTDSRRILKIAKNKDGAANAGMFLDFDGATQTFRKSLNQLPKKKTKTDRDEDDYAAAERTGMRMHEVTEPIPQEIMDGWSKQAPF